MALVRGWTLCRRWTADWSLPEILNLLFSYTSPLSTHNYLYFHIHSRVVPTFPRQSFVFIDIPASFPRFLKLLFFSFPKNIGSRRKAEGSRQ